MQPSARCFLVAGILLTASWARAQSLFANFQLHWTEVNASTHNPVPSPNGTLEPGEAARIGFSVEFSPVGTVFGSETVAGFVRTGFLLGGGVPGSWSDVQVPPGFLSPSPPQFFPSGGITAVWQPHPTLGNFPIATNPIQSLWSVVWTPTQYSQASPIFGITYVFDDETYLFMRSGTDPQGNAIFTTRWIEAANWGSPIVIPIVPSPLVSTLAFIAGALTTRRPLRA